MGKKKIGFKSASNKVNSLKNAVSDSEDDEAIENRLQSILEDEIDQYNAFKDNALLEKGKGVRKVVNKNKDEDEEEEIYELGLTSSEDEEDEGDVGGKRKKDFDFDEDEDEELDEMDDDEILGKDLDRGIPDSRAWGKKAKVFHNTDYVDQDFGGFDGSDAEMAEQEETEAKEIQKRLTAELDENDFLGLVPVAKRDGKKGEKVKEVLKLDFDKLSVAEKRKLIERECPEVVHMLDEYKEKLKEARVLKKEMTDGDDEILKRFYQSKFHTLLNYCINLSYYLYLRATSPTNCKGHPVVKRILQFRRLLDELVQFDPSKYVPIPNPVLSISKKSKSKVKPKTAATNDDMEIQMGESKQEVQFQFDNESEEESQEKRGITYAIAKNKGLTPKRKKELRNPRVKHREKYRKAQIRRKGQVRVARTEKNLYDGEASGIKSHLTKSIKLK